jgi:hypothetical protein
MRTKFSTQEYLQKVTKVHGHRYDLTSIEYQGHNKKVTVLCRDHGIFKIRATNFIQGVGCALCGSKSSADKHRSSVEAFVRKARKVHGAQYDYLLVRYVSTHRNVNIRCLTHGVFAQSPSNHLSGKGCRQCGIDNNAKRQRKSAEDFIVSANIRHGGKYDYSLVQYRDAKTRVQIVCKAHGEFSQTPNKHCDAGQGCPRCANRDMDLKKFVSRATTKHQNRYSYRNAEYRGARALIAVTCEKHGDFNQRADHHLRGIGCALCVDALNSKGVRRIEEWLLAKGIEFFREVFLRHISTENGIGIAKLRFDFWLPSRRTAIEFDGRQHFEPIARWGGEGSLRKQAVNDRKKEAWAATNEIRLIRVRFDQESDIDARLMCLDTDAN